MDSMAHLEEVKNGIQLLEEVVYWSGINPSYAPSTVYCGEHMTVLRVSWYLGTDPLQLPSELRSAIDQAQRETLKPYPSPSLIQERLRIILDALYWVEAWLETMQEIEVAAEREQRTKRIQEDRIASFHTHRGHYVAECCGMIERLNLGATISVTQETPVDQLMSWYDYLKQMEIEEVTGSQRSSAASCAA